MVFTVIFLVITINCVVTNSDPKPFSEDGCLNFTELSKKYGYRTEVHSVVTEDGYMLSLFHLKGKKNPPVLLLHGLFDSADTFIIRGNRSLAIALANRGHDVWVGNGRGNKYSRQHTKLNPDKDPSFWDFSFHEHGYYDLAAITDYILNATGEKSLQSIGHSQGTTDHFVLGSLRPEYNKKIKIFIALAPVALLNNLKPPTSILVEMGPYINQFYITMKKEEIFKDNGLWSSVREMICGQGAVSYELCVQRIVFSITGHDPQRFEPEFLPTIVMHYPTSSSRKSLYHYNQIALRKRFALYDYGFEDNLKRYGLLTPPDYNLTMVTMKTAFIVGKNDKLAPAKDAEHISRLLPNIVQYHVMQPKKWNHLDFVWGNDMPKTLFPYIFSLLEKYN